MIILEVVNVLSVVRILRRKHKMKQQIKIDYSKLTTHWMDMCMSIDCPECHKKVYLDVQNGKTVCECGITYMLDYNIVAFKEDKE